MKHHILLYFIRYIQITTWCRTRRRTKGETSGEANNLKNKEGKQEPIGINVRKIRNLSGERIGIKKLTK